jgi:hypothetical protein
VPATITFLPGAGPYLVILWEREGQTVAIAYKNGQVVMSRPLEEGTFDAGTRLCLTPRCPRILQKYRRTPLMSSTIKKAL